jgi:hypothetical protein
LYSHTVLQHQRLRREIEVTWKQIDQLIEAKRHTESEAEVQHVNRKIDDVARFHNRTVVQANEYLDTMSGRLLRHMKGVRRLNTYERDS